MGKGREYNGDERFCRLESKDIGGIGLLLIESR